MIYSTWPLSLTLSSWIGHIRLEDLSLKLLGNKRNMCQGHRHETIVKESQFFGRVINLRYLKKNSTRDQRPWYIRSVHNCGLSKSVLVGKGNKTQLWQTTPTLQGLILCNKQESRAQSTHNPIRVGKGFAPHSGSPASSLWGFHFLLGLRNSHSAQVWEKSMFQGVRVARMFGLVLLSKNQA